MTTTDPPTLTELLDLGEQHARKILIELKQPELTPFYHLVIPDQPDVIVPCNFQSVDDKEVTVAIVSAMAAIMSAIAVMFVSEAWMAVVSADQDPYAIAPSQHPDRIEVVTLIASDGNQTLHRKLDMVRNKRGKLTKLERRDQDDIDHAGGRMIDNIIPTTHTRH